MDALSLSTNGIITEGDITLNIRRVLPFNLNLNTDPAKLSLKKQGTIKLNTVATTKKLVLKVLPKTKINIKRVNKIKINIKKCEN